MNKVDYSSYNWLIARINNGVIERNRGLIRGRVIDMGCGDCVYKEDIEEVADEYIGVDWHDSQHECGEVDVWADLTEALPFPDDYANTIVSFQVMEHLPEPIGFLSECFRILMPGGRIIVTVPFMWGIHEEPQDYYRYTRYGLQYLLGKAGFENIEISENAGFWTTWILRFNYHSRRYAGSLLRIILVPVWFVGQAAAIVLDKVNRNTADATSYTASAIKP